MNKKARIEKVVSQLPSTLQKNTVYYVRVGNGFDIYVTNDSGFIVAYPANYQPLGQYVRIGGTGTTGNNILIGWTGSELQATVDATIIGNLATQVYVNTRIADNLVNYVTIGTPQDINARKSIGGGISNTFSGAALEIRGNGSTIYPSLSFHQPGQYAGIISLRNDYEFSFMNISGNGYNYLKSAGYIKEGSSNAHVLLGDGSDKPISDFATSAQLVNYLPLSGGTLTGGGRIDSQGTIVVQQASTNNATGLFWEKMDNTDRMAGIGALTTGDNLDTLYMGWGAYPWLSSESFTVSPNFIRYKNNIVWHEGNLPNPVTQNQLNDYPTFGNLSNSLSTKVDALEEVKGLGFAGSDFKYPYIRRLDGNSTILSTRDFVISSTENKINSEANAVAVGFVGGAPDTPYIKHSNGTNTPVATETWSSNNFVTLSSFQNITGVKTYTVSPKVPFAIESDDAIPLGQAEEVAQTRINDTFFEIIYKNSATDLTFDFNDYPNAKVVTIACKGNNFQNIRIENMPRSVTLKIMNGSVSLSPTIYFDGGTIVTGFGNATWGEFYRDQEGDIFKNNVNGTNII